MAASSAIDLVVVNGCSMTMGRGLDDPQTMTWGAHVASNLGARLLNLGAGGGSNARLVRTSMEQFALLKATTAFDPSRILFIGMWTEPCRFEAYADHVDRGFRPVSDDLHWERLAPWRVRRGHRRSMIYLRYFQHTRGDVIRFMVDYLALQSYLRLIGVHFAFCLAWDFLPRNWHSLHGELIAEIDQGRLLGGLARCGDVSFGAVVARGGYPLEPNGLHPLAEGHLAYGEQLVPWCTSLIDGGRGAVVTEI